MIQKNSTDFIFFGRVTHQQACNYSKSLGKYCFLFKSGSDPKGLLDWVDGVKEEMMLKHQFAANYNIVFAHHFPSFSQ